MAEYYSAELSQKIRRGNNESRLKGNLTGGKIPYGYKNVNKKAVIVPEQAEVVRYIYEQYSIGVYVKDIIASLTNKGIYYFGKPFVPNTVYKILKNERYSGICRHENKIYDNIYPQIVPQDTFQRVRDKVLKNQYGKNSIKVVYLLRNKLKCGYCGQTIIGEMGTAHNGERKYYYKCRGRKARLNDCKKSAIRKDVLENIVLDTVITELKKPHIMESIINGVLQAQERQAQCNTVLNLLIKEQRQTDNAINNIMNAIEQGGSTATAMKRLRDLESKQEDLKKRILIEKSKTAVQVTENQVREFYEKALRLKPQMLIEYLIKEILLFDDKIQLQFNTP